MRDLQPSMAARFGTHLWFRGFLKARIGLTTAAEIYLEQQKIEEINAEEDGPPAVRQTGFQPVEISVAAVYDPGQASALSSAQCKA